MKKLTTLLALVLTAVMVFTFAGCSNNNKPSGDAGSGAADASGAGNATGGELVMATEPGFAPYEYMVGEEIVGVDVDIANEIAKAMGKTLKIENIDFDGALLSVASGKVDFAAAGISVTPEREESMDFSIPYATSKQVVVVVKDAGKVTAPTELSGKKVGVQLGTVADVVISDPTEEFGAEVVTYTKYAQAAEDLKNGRLDCIVMDLLPAQEMVKANETLALLDGEVFTDVYAIAVKKGNKELLEQINTVLQKLIDDGKIDEFTLNHTGK